MTAEHEVLILCDSRLPDGRWHVTPEIRDCLGWWPDGSPAWIDHPEYADGNRMVICVIPKRKPDGEQSLEDNPRVETLIDMAMTLNDVFRPWPGTALADAYAVGDMETQSMAMLARIRQSFGPAETPRVLELAREITTMRRAAIP